MKTLSLDIRNGLSPEINISGAFPLAEVHAINGRHKPILDEIITERETISLYKKTELEIDDFENFPILDIVHPALITSSFWQKKFPYLSYTTRTITLNPPLKIPFHALDIREEKAIISQKKYSDIFTRKLSSRLYFKRFSRQSRFFWNRNKMRIFYVFSVIFLTCVPTILYVKFAAENAVQTLKSLPYSQNITEIQEKTHSARLDFERASLLWTPFSWLPFEKIDTVTRATSGGKEATKALDIFIQTFPKNTETPSLKIVENTDNTLYRGNSKDIFPTENIGIPFPSNFIADHSKEFKQAISHLENAKNIFENSHGNDENAKKLQDAGKILKNILPVLKNYEENEHSILEILWHKEPQRYIIFNQNRDEIRANGGFPGSIISFTLYKGNILDYRTDDVYYYDWNLYPHVETPPPGIALLTNNYGLRDVNYYPDFLETLEKANTFVEKSGDSTLTTAIAIHQGLIEDILAEIGEVEVEWVSEKFSHKNFSILMSILVENKFAKEKTPKDILFKFISAFGKKTMESRKIVEISEIIKKYYENSEILFASRSTSVQKFFKKIQKPLPWETDAKNWIYPVFTSISGNKSDRYISREITTKISPLGDCRYETEVSLTLTHNFSRHDEEMIENFMNTFGLENAEERKKMQFIQGNGKNINYVRLFVPKWSILSGSGAEISEEENATVFAFNMETPVGGKTTKNISYTREIPNCYEYKGEILIERQPGLKDLIIH